ncbi:MAG: hypothetical protein PUB34_02710 [Clostridia bacterium]|nr:hypothetical protein [Clostridia bacterium]
MIEIREATTKKEQKNFLNFPLEMYKNNPCFVPPLYSSEKKIFGKSYSYYDTCEAVYYNAYRDGVMAGRISGILQHTSNKIRNQKRVRFTRFDCIDDVDTARALFGAVEKWALSKGMDTICGPLGFSDLEREGLLIEGFDELSTFEEQYNAEYYGRLIEECGYNKEVDWIESKIYPPKDTESLDKMKDYIMKRYSLRFGEAKNINEFIKKYKNDFFRLLDEGYADIYGSVPFTESMKKEIISNFKLVCDTEHVAVILDKDNRAVCMGFCIPSISRAVQKSKGHLTPCAIVKILKSVRRPEIIDLGLIAVDKEYLNRGISIIFCAEIARMLKKPYTKYAETNLNLEDNHSIRNMWKRFEQIEHKKRRSYVKYIGENVNA